MAVITAGHSSKYGIWLILGIVAIVVALLALFIWKGSSLFNRNAAPPAEMQGYNPNAVPAKPNAPSH